MKSLPVIKLLSVFFIVYSNAINADNVTVTTLEWPPYTSVSLPQGGATTAIVKQAFDNAEISSSVKTLPWKRAISEAKNNADSIAYFPGYHCRHVEGFISSDPIGYGPLGFVENSEFPITWNSLDNLGEQKLTIGTVLGYANTDEFDEKAGTGWIKVVPAKDDVTNLRKLIRKRIDAAVIDKLVLSYLLATETKLNSAKGLLNFDEKPLEEKTLYLCFNDNETGRDLRDRFNKGLAQLDVEKIVEDYFNQEF